MTTATQQPDLTETTQERFMAATRSSWFTLSLGVREIRFLANEVWRRGYGDMDRNEISTSWRLYNKGLLEHSAAGPYLSRAGHLCYDLLVESQHISK